ncbi:hypothetical protein NDI76_04740 [Halogeometricum sp. S1BR25-6]|uniref:Nucleic acid-binding protein n=1 Tax=Halogeometricum salsisoli TaxID=2950536 RepID=A0ABU2GC54_9EURY|nr:hypothetical protein [Halogeometricum sp. S1BR25-6]MDS0298041.1 hypothetical protein [Halogeometricum sp. S1BR25-6]
MDATTLIALGNVGELELLLDFDGQIVITPRVANEVSAEPARTNLDQFGQRSGVRRRPTSALSDAKLTEAKDLLGDSELNGDAEVIAGVLIGVQRSSMDRREGTSMASLVAVVSDDRRVRTVAESLGATVTGTIGVVVRAVHEEMDPDEAKELVRRLDSQGLHMTGELRETAYRLVEEAAKERENR